MPVFLSELDRLTYAARAASSAMAEPARPGHLALYNKNDWTTWHVPATRHPRCHGWVLDVEWDEIPPYWAGSLLDIPL
jgi:hypothetical protein